MNPPATETPAPLAVFLHAQKEELITFIPMLSGFSSHGESDRPRRRASLLAFTRICMPEEANSCSIVSNYAKNVQRWFEKTKCKTTRTSSCLKEEHLRRSAAKYKAYFVLAAAQLFVCV